MIFHQHDIEGLTTEVTVCPLGDIQWNGDRKEVWVSGLRDHLKFTEKQPHPLYIGLGDYTDFASPSSRQKLLAAGLYDGPKASMDRTANHLVKEVREMLEVTHGKWLAMVSGHHVWEYMGDSYKKEFLNSDMRLAHQLRAPYAGWGTVVVQLRFIGRSKGGDKVQSLWMWANHGCSYGQRAYSPLTKLENLAGFYEGIDVFMMGHQTKKPHVPIPKMIPNVRGNKMHLSHRDVHLVGTGGWSRGYLEGVVGKLVEPSYVERGLMNPVALGAPVIHIRPSVNLKEGVQVWHPNIKVEA